MSGLAKTYLNRNGLKYNKKCEPFYIQTDVSDVIQLINVCVRKIYIFKVINGQNSPF